MRRSHPRFPGILTGLLILASAGFAGPQTLNAQATRADSAAVLLRAAQTFQADGRWEVAEALFHYITERFGDTPAGADAQTALRGAPAEDAGRRGQVELMVWATTYGAWLGVAIPGALGAESSEAYGAGLLLGGPGGFLGGRALSRSRPLSEGQVRAITFGSSWGTWQGYGLMEVLDWGEREECSEYGCYVEGPDGPDVFKALVLGGLAGTVTGAILSKRPIPSGVSTSVNFGALWGTWFGLAGGILADQEGDGLLATTLLAGDAGLLGTALLAPGWNISRNRARLVSIAGVLGGLVGGGLDLLIQPDNEKVAIGIPLAASIAGLALGASATSDMDRIGTSSAERLQEDDGALGPGSSVVHLQNGAFTVSLPAPYPTLMLVDGPRGRAFKPALGLTLFSSRF